MTRVERITAARRAVVEATGVTWFPCSKRLAVHRALHIQHSVRSKPRMRLITRALRYGVRFAP